METSGSSPEQFDQQVGTGERFESLEELLAKMRTPESQAAARSLFTATSHEISVATAGSRFRRLEGEIAKPGSSLSADHAEEGTDQ
jgi:hypothetical protein